MKIKGHEITIVENHANEPWPRSVCYDGKRMDYNHRWENTVRGQIIYYKAPDDNSVFQGVGILRKDLLRVAEGCDIAPEAQEIIDNGNYDAAVALMDDEIREAVHADLAPCSEAEFLTEYMARHIAKYGEPFRV